MTTPTPAIARRSRSGSSTPATRRSRAACRGATAARRRRCARPARASARAAAARRRRSARCDRWRRRPGLVQMCSCRPSSGAGPSATSVRNDPVRTVSDMPRVALVMHGSAMLYEAAIAAEIFGVDRSDLLPAASGTTSWSAPPTASRTLGCRTCRPRRTPRSLASTRSSCRPPTTSTRSRTRRSSRRCAWRTGAVCGSRRCAPAPSCWRRPGCSTVASRPRTGCTPTTWPAATRRSTCAPTCSTSTRATCSPRRARRRRSTSASTSYAATSAPPPPTGSRGDSSCPPTAAAGRRSSSSRPPSRAAPTGSRRRSSGRGPASISP